jgi:putative ABC transport system permease protein
VIVNEKAPLPIRAFRLLLRLLPLELRFDHGREMEQVVREQVRDAGESGRRGSQVGAWLSAAFDVLRTAPREHLADARRDAAYALRGLRRNPAFGLVVVVTLALGIGANTAIFSVFDGVLLRPAPLRDLDRLVMVWETDRHTGTFREPASVPDYLDFAARSRRLDRVGAFLAAEVNLSPTGAEPTRLAALMVSHTLLPMLGVRPVAGRLFTAAEDVAGGPRVILISDALWERIFNRAPSAVGSSLRLDERPYTIVGVLPAESAFGVPQVLAAGAYSRSFADRGAGVRIDVWAPLQPDVKALPRDTHPIFVVGRLAAGVAPAAAQEELAAIAADLERAYPSNEARGAFVEPLGNVVFGRVRPALLLLMGAVGLVLLVACVNVANLLLARGIARGREIAIRTALGAGGWRLGRQFLIENLVLTLTAAGVGVVLAFVLLNALLALAPADVPRLDEVRIDLRVLALTLAASVFVGVVFGLVPSLQARRVDVQVGLASGSRQSPGRRASQLRAALVASEVALAVTLVVGAGLLIRSFWQLQRVDPGFRAAGVLKAEFQLPPSRYPADFRNWPDFREIHAFNRALLERASALPDVEAAAIAGNHPLDPGFTNSFTIAGREEEARSWPEISIRRVTPGYFRTVGLALVSGRLLSDSDTTTGPPVVVVNAAAAKRFFPGRDPAGARINFWGAPRTVVGVVADERFQGIAVPAPIAVYAPLAQVPSVNGAGVLLVRTTGDPVALGPLVRAVVREQDPALAVFGLEPLDRTVSRSVSERRFTMLLLAVLAAVALVLAAVGVQGILAYEVSRRTREIGIRMALGARPEEVRRRIVGQALAFAAAGLVLGLGGAYAVARLFGSFLFEIAPGDPATFGGVAAFLLATALAASYGPARRATRVDPVAALRAE